MPNPAIQGEEVMGAAKLWCVLRDLISLSSSVSFTREDILVFLDEVQKIPGLVEPGRIKEIADAIEEL